MTTENQEPVINFRESIIAVNKDMALTLEEIQEHGHIGKRRKQVIVVTPKCFKKDFSGTSMAFQTREQENRVLRIICDAEEAGAIMTDDALLEALLEAGNKEEVK